MIVLIKIFVQKFKMIEFDDRVRRHWYLKKLSIQSHLTWINFWRLNFLRKYLWKSVFTKNSENFSYKNFLKKKIEKIIFVWKNIAVGNPRVRALSELSSLLCYYRFRSYSVFRAKATFFNEAMFQNLGQQYLDIRLCCAFKRTKKTFGTGGFWPNMNKSQAKIEKWSVGTKNLNFVILDPYPQNYAHSNFIWINSSEGVAAFL